MRRIICIGRQCGSNGHVIAQKTAEKLNIPCYDKEILEKAVQSSGLSKDILEKADEKAANPFLYSVWYDGISAEYHGRSTNDILFLAEQKIILDFAAEHDCVFVGRCADYILKKDPQFSVLSVYITAATDYKIQTIMATNHLNEKDAANLIRRTDKARKTYYDYYTGNDWGKPSDYDITLNASSLGESRIVDFLTRIYETMGAENKPTL